jgi:hypothetical protein
MYRQYEDPHKLEKQQKKLKEEYRQAIEEGADEATLIGYSWEIAELNDIINFAWQDDEYDEIESP